MHFDILTLFPDLFAGVFQESIVKRAREAGQVTIALHNIRDYATDKHHITDDAPYGGGGGMVMKPEPIFAAVFAWTVGGETFMPNRALGGMLVVAAIIVAELPLRPWRLGQVAGQT